MDEVRKKKIIGKMYSKLLCTKEEYESGDVSLERIEMFVKDIPLLVGAASVQGQIEARESALNHCKKAGDDKMISVHQKILNKLYELKDKFKEEKPKKVVSFKKTGAKTQLEEVRNHLKEKGSITSWDAFLDFGITRLSAIIYKLRWDEGMVIGSETITKTNRYGNLVNFSKYTHEDNGKKA